MVPDILEIPPGSSVPGYAPLPRRMMRWDDTVGGELREARGFRDLGEPQRFRGEADSCGPDVVQGSQIRTDAVVVGEAGAGVEGECPTRGGGGPVGSPRMLRRHQLRQLRPEEGMAPRLPRGAVHGGLLFHLAPPAPRDHAGVRARPSERLAGLGLHLGAEVFVVEWIVHVGEHEVLPDHDPQLVARPVERRVGVDHGPAHADHVAPGIPQALQDGPDRLLGAVQLGRRGRRPARPSAENLLPIDAVADVSIALLHLQPAEPDGPQRQSDGSPAALRLEHAHEEVLSAVGVRPPEGEARERALRLHGP